MAASQPADTDPADPAVRLLQRVRELLLECRAVAVHLNGELLAQGYAQVMTIPPNVRHQELRLVIRSNFVGCSTVSLTA